MNELDERIRAALHAAVDGLREQDLRPAEPPRAQPRKWSSARWVGPLLAAAAVVAIAVTVVTLTESGNTSHPIVGGGSPSPAPTAVNTGSPAPSPSASKSPTPAPSSSGPGYNCYFDFEPAHVCSTPAGYVGYEPLWPFADFKQAQQWQTVDGPNGHSPWHLDAKATALFFATGYLHFQDITDVSSSDIRPNEALIGVGYKLPGGQRHEAALLRLVRFSPTFGDKTAPWEVVGTIDSDFSITQPRYASTVTSPMTVGGRITGTDENITVAVRTADGNVDKVAPVPAGGQDAPWTVTVPFTERGVLAVVASTGGHLTQHERFAVVGVVTAGS